jgi:hypothetical protein
MSLALHASGAGDSIPRIGCWHPAGSPAAKPRGSRASIRAAMVRKTAALLLLTGICACGGGGGGGAPGAGPVASITATPEFTRGFAQFAGTPVATAAGDVDGDGRDDLIVVTAEDEQLYVFYPRANGPESVSVPSAAAGGSDKTRSTAICDVDGDGRNEILVGYSAGDLTIYKTAPDGRPALWRTLAGVGSERLVCSDVDGDGRSDVIAGGKAGVTMQVLLQRAGELAEEAAYPINGVTPVLHDVGDVDGDGRADVLVLGRRSSDGQNELYAHVQTSPGRFGMPTSLDFPPAAAFAIGGQNIVAVTGANAGAAQVIVQPAGGGATLALPTADLPAHVRIRDINGDGRPDIAVLHGDALGVYYQNADGTFTAEQVLATYAADASSGAPAIAFGDFDDDGKLDVAVASRTALSLFFQD